MLVTKNEMKRKMDKIATILSKESSEISKAFEATNEKIEALYSYLGLHCVRQDKYVIKEKEND